MQYHIIPKKRWAITVYLSAVGDKLVDWPDRDTFSH